MKRSDACLILGLETLKPGKAEVEEAFRIAVQMSHPDKYQSNPKLLAAAEKKMKQLNEAREVLLSGRWEAEATATPTATPRPTTTTPSDEASDARERWVAAEVAARKRAAARQEQEQEAARRTDEQEQLDNWQEETRSLIEKETRSFEYLSLSALIGLVASVVVTTVFSLAAPESSLLSLQAIGSTFKTWLTAFCLINTAGFVLWLFASAGKTGFLAVVSFLVPVAAFGLTVLATLNVPIQLGGGADFFEYLVLLGWAAALIALTVRILIRTRQRIRSAKATLGDF